jgi:hypothetical protein
MDLEELLWHCFAKMYHEDNANAAMHCAPVRFSPLTFRIAEHLDLLVPEVPGPNEDVYVAVRQVLLDRGRYKEDPGR